MNSSGFLSFTKFQKTWWIHQVSTLVIFSWIFTVKTDNFHQKKAQSAYFGEFQSYKTLLSPGFHQGFFSQNATKPGEFTRFSPSSLNFTIFHKTWWIHQAFTRFSPSLFFTKFHKAWWIYQVFTRFLRGFFNFHKMSQNLVSSPGFHKVFTRFFYFLHNCFHQVFYFSQKSTKPGEFTRFSPHFHQVLYFSHRWMHQVFIRLLILERNQVFTRFFIFHKILQNLSFYLPQNSTKPGEFTRFSPGFHLGDFFLDSYRQSG